MSAAYPAERCLCGATDCPSCGPAQGYRYPPPTAREESEIERRAADLLDERLYDDLVQFDDLMAGIEPTIYLPQLQRALANLDRACKGERIALDAITTALSQIQRVVKGEAERLWLDELKDEAAGEVLGAPA